MGGGGVELLGGGGAVRRVAGGRDVGATCLEERCYRSGLGSGGLDGQSGVGSSGLDCWISVMRERNIWYGPWFGSSRVSLKTLAVYL